MHEIHPRSTKLLQDFVKEDDVLWNYKLYMNDIEIVKLDFFRSDPYQDYFRYLDSMGGFWLYRWGDHAMRTVALAMWVDESKILEMDVPYGHQGYCKCGEIDYSKGLAPQKCVRSGSLNQTPSEWWACVPVEPGDVPPNEQEDDGLDKVNDFGQ